MPRTNGHCSDFQPSPKRMRKSRLEKTVAMSARGYDKASDAKKALEFVKHTLNTVKVTEVKGEKK